MITTPEQMREAAAQIAKSYDLSVMSSTHADIRADQIAASIRAIPIAPQPVDDQAADMKRIAYKAGYVQAECGLPCPSDIDAAFSDWIAKAAPQPAAVTVKPLEWDGHVAHTTFGSYAVHDCRGYGQTYRLRLPMGVEGHTMLDHGSELMFTTQELAQAAAQADYEARILSALTIQPADPLSDPRVVALVEATKAFIHDVDDLIANSEGVSGLHMNGDVADWESLLPGGLFGAWLVSIDEFRAALRAIGGEA